MGKKLVMYLINDSNYGPKTIDIGNCSGRGMGTSNRRWIDRM